MSKIPVLDLFSGVGAYSLGLERTGGFETVAFCEIEEYPRKILKRHWPHVPIYEDVTALTGERLRADGIVPRWIVAGWPCQDVSVAGTGSGLDGARSGLWSEIARLAREIGADGLILENSANLLAINGGADFGVVLRDLAALGMHVEWHCLPAAAFDAPHIRDRLWIVAHRRGVDADTDLARLEGLGGHVAGGGEPGWIAEAARRHAAATDLCAGAEDADANEGRRHWRAWSEREAQGRGQSADGGVAADAHGHAPVGTAIARRERHTWEPEPDVVRVVHGCPNRMERIACLGNLNPPIIPETIGRAILEAIT